MLCALDCRAKRRTFKASVEIREKLFSFVFDAISFYEGDGNSNRNDYSKLFESRRRNYFSFDLRMEINFVDVGVRSVRRSRWISANLFVDGLRSSSRKKIPLKTKVLSNFFFFSG